MPRQKVKNCGVDILSAQYRVVEERQIPQYVPDSNSNQTFCRRVGKASDEKEIKLK
jgi:hypothetical protein